MLLNERKNWITEKEAAAIIQLPATFFRKLVLNGPLKGVVNYLKTKGYRYNRMDIENYIFENSFFAGL